MAYRANVTDKQQVDVERAEDDSAIRVQWFDGKAVQTGETKSFRAYDLSAQGNVGSQTVSAEIQVSRSGESTGVAAIVGSHNDKPYQFSTPGKV